MAKNMKKYGGYWTENKLGMLRGYLNAYTLALKDRFKLMYIDAFAGTGMVELEDRNSDTQKFIAGSALIAAKTGNKPFDKLIFIERSKKRCQDLEKLRDRYQSRAIKVENTDANIYLQEFCRNWNEIHSNWRGVLFLDPFSTQMEWKTVEAVASTRALDTWILVPISALIRMLPDDKKPEDVDQTWAEKLTNVFGDESWKTLYHLDPQMNFITSEPTYGRYPGAELIRIAYKQKLRGAFGNRLLEQTRLFTNTKKSPLFEFIFCAGSDTNKAIGLSHKIASHIIGKKGA